VHRTLGPLPLRSRCLVSSLVLIRLLAARGMHAKLVIGTSLQSTFIAHAWVEYEGSALLPPGDFRDGRLVEL
jgi:hypothetical protein